MCVSSRRRLACLLIGVSAAIAGCDDPLATMPAPPDRRMDVSLILFPDSAVQYLTIANTYGGDPVFNAAAQLSDGTTTTTGVVLSGAEWQRCLNHRGGAGTPTCIRFDVTPQPTRTYSIQVTGTDRPTVTGSTTVPGDFHIVSVSTTGAPGANASINATWTTSPGVYRYVVALRQNRSTFCVPDVACNARWYAVTTDTTLSASLLPAHFVGGTAPWFVDVYAMNQDTFGYLMTGADAGLFNVPAASNLTNGYGAIIAWVRRSEEVFK